MAAHILVRTGRSAEPDEETIIEQCLKDQLDRAGVSYSEARGEQIVEARLAYASALRRFTAYVTRGQIPPDLKSLAR